MNHMPCFLFETTAASEASSLARATCTFPTCFFACRNLNFVHVFCPCFDVDGAHLFCSILLLRSRDFSLLCYEKMPSVSLQRPQVNVRASCMSFAPCLTQAVVSALAWPFLAASSPILHGCPPGSCALQICFVFSFNFLRKARRYFCI